MRALVTGINGFVGSHLAEYLLACGDRVLGLVRAANRPLPPSLRDVPTVAWDLASDSCPRETVEAIVRFAPQAVYHLAAISIPAECGDEHPTPQAVAVNVEGTRRLVTLLGSIGFTGRFLPASSSYVYPAPPADDPVTPESTPVRPRRGYGQTKLTAEKIVVDASRAAGFEAVIARAFPHTGPRQSPRMMLPEWTRQFVLGVDPIEVRTLEAVIDLSDVRDVVRAYRLLIERGEAGGVYNVGSGIVRTSGEVFELLRQMADPTRGVRETQPGKKVDPVADVTKLRALGLVAQLLAERDHRLCSGLVAANPYLGLTCLPPPTRYPRHFLPNLLAKSPILGIFSELFACRGAADADSI
ncbi:GDP-mannose 4,6-dehydratase [Thermostilla marina]